MTDKQVYSNPPILSGGGKRIKWVDTAKALGLFLVFWGHILYGGSEVAGVINRTIYSFHMPMYFILSGYVLKPDSKTFGHYIKGKFYRILLPALIVYIFTLPLYFYFLDKTTATFGSVIKTICYFDGQCAYNSPIWFFFCLFEVYILTKLLKLAEANNPKLMIILMVSLVLSFMFYSLGWDVFNTFGFNKCVLGLFFVAFGLLMKRIPYEKRVKKIGFLSLPIWIITGIWLNPKVSMYSDYYGQFWIFIVGALAGTFVFLAFSKLVENSGTIRQYAKWTIFIVCSHYVLVTCFQWFSSKFEIGGSYLFDITSALFVLIALLAYKPLCVFIDKHIPVLMGNKRVCKN